MITGDQPVSKNLYGHQISVQISQTIIYYTIPMFTCLTACDTLASLILHNAHFINQYAKQLPRGCSVFQYPQKIT